MTKFAIDIIYYFDRAELVAEIYFDHVQWAEISSKNGEFIVKFYSHPNKDCWEFSYEDAKKILERAKNRLIEKLNAESSLFSVISTSPEQVNQQGQQILEEILRHPEARVYPNRFGGKDIFEPSGKGARFDRDENFLGFLQKRQR